MYGVFRKGPQSNPHDCRERLVSRPYHVGAFNYRNKKWKENLHTDSTMEMERGFFFHFVFMTVDCAGDVICIVNGAY